MAVTCGPWVIAAILGLAYGCLSNWRESQHKAKMRRLFDGGLYNMTTAERRYWNKNSCLKVGYAEEKA